MDLMLLSKFEICRTLGQRLKQQRLLKRFKQQELADRAGVSLGTIKNLETKGQITLETLIGILMALGLIQEIDRLFLIKSQTIAEMEKIDKILKLNKPKRIR